MEKVPARSKLEVRGHLPATNLLNHHRRNLILDNDSAGLTMGMLKQDGLIGAWV